MSSAIFLYFSDYNKLKLIYTLASLAKASWPRGASWTGGVTGPFPSPSPAKTRVCKGTRQHDPSGASKEKEKKTRRYLSSAAGKEELTGTGIGGILTFFGHFFPSKLQESWER